MITISRVADLGRLTRVENLSGVTFTGEEDGHKFVISAMLDNAVVPLTGHVSGKFIRPNGETVALTESEDYAGIEEGKAWVILAGNCYSEAGPFGLSISHIEGSKRTVIYACAGYIRPGETSSIVDPENLVNIDAIAAMMGQMEDATAAAEAAAAFVPNVIAPEYSTSGTYAVGDYCTRNGYLYRCNTAISTAEAWTAAHWTQVTTGAEIGNLKSAFNVTALDLVDKDETVSIPSGAYKNGTLLEDRTLSANGNYRCFMPRNVHSDSLCINLPVSGYSMRVYVWEQTGENTYKLIQNSGWTKEAVLVKGDETLQGVETLSYGISFKVDSGVTISTDVINSNLEICKLYNFDEIKNNAAAVDATLTRTGIPADAEATGDAINGLKSAFNVLNSSVIDSSENLLPPTLTNNKYWNEDHTKGDNSGCKCTDELSLESGNVYIYLPLNDYNIRVIAWIETNETYTCIYNSGWTKEPVLVHGGENVKYSVSFNVDSGTTINTDTILSGLQFYKLIDSEKIYSEISTTTGVEFCRFSNGYILTNVETGATVDMTVVGNTALNHAVINCTEGDVITINGTGWTSARLWAFVDSNDKLIKKALENVVADNLKVKAPANSAKCIIGLRASATGVCYKGETVPEAMAEAKNQVAFVTDALVSGQIVASYGSDKLYSGNAIGPDGEETGQNASYYTDFITAQPGGYVTSVFTYDSSTVGAAWYHYVYFYNASKSMIGDRIGGSKNATVQGQAPENTAYVRVSLTRVNLSSLVNYSLTVSTPIKGCGSPKNKWYVFGDSISAGYYSITDEEAAEKGVTIDYRPDEGYGVTSVGSVWDSTLSHNYWGYANEWFLRRQLVGKAYPGQGYIQFAANSKNGIAEVVEADLSDAGLITVAWGFNDWHNNGNQRGSRPNYTRGDHDLIDASVPYPTAGYDTTQLTTINHAIWFCLGELIRKAPLAKIVVQTPMNGWLYGGDFSTNWGIEYNMSNVGRIRDIHDDIVYWANYYGLQVLDMTYNNSMVNRMNIQQALLDGSHPSDPVHMQLARHVATKLGYC